MPVLNASCAGDPPGQARDEVVADPADWYPLPSVELSVTEADLRLVAAELAAVKDVDDLVALAGVRCPVDDQQPARGTTVPVTDLATALIRRHKVLGGLIHEYEQAA